MKLRIALATAVLAIAAASAASAAEVTATATATATIIAPGQITKTRDLKFGTIVKPSSGTNTVTVASAAAAAATPTVSGGGNGLVPTSGQASAATFRLVGSPGQLYTVTGNALTFTSAAGNLSSVGSESPVSAANTLNTLPGSSASTPGVDDLYVGGHFDITSATAPATYTGTLSLTVNFN